MASEVKLPPLGEDAPDEAEVSFWYLEEGETVEEGQDLVEMVIPPVPDEEPLLLEIQDFILSTQGVKPPEVPGKAGVRALEVVSRIMGDIERRLSMWGD